MFLIVAALHNIVNGLIPYEKGAFFFINGHYNPFLDQFMWLYSGKVIWIPLAFVALLVFSVKANWKESLLTIVFFALLCALCDQTASSIIRPLFERFRPTHYPGIENLVHIINNYRGGKYGFISAHATNGFGIATFTALLFRNRIYTFVIYLWVIITAYSRVYLGVHFVGDVLGGMFIGIFYGWLIYTLYTLTRRRIMQLTSAESRQCFVSPTRANWLIYAYFATLLVVIVVAFIEM